MTLKISNHGLLNTLEDINVRKVQVLGSNKLEKIWKPNLKREIKVRLFISTVKKVIIYAWLRIMDNQ